MSCQISDCLIVEELDGVDVLVWMVDTSRAEKLSASRLPPTATIGSFLKISSNCFELVDKSVCVCVEGSCVTVKDWFLVVRGGNAVFSRFLGIIDIVADDNFRSDRRLMYMECAWDRQRGRMVVRTPPIEWKSEDSIQCEHVLQLYRISHVDSFWVDGIVTGTKDGLWFVGTPAGSAVLFPNHRDECDVVDIRVGMCCRVSIIPIRSERSCRFKIITLNEQAVPTHMKMKLNGSKVDVTCTAELIEIVGSPKAPHYWVFYDPFMGNITMFDSVRPRDVSFSLGDIVRLYTVQRPRNTENIPGVWFATRFIERIDRRLPVSPLPWTKPYFGLVGMVAKDGLGYVFCNDFSRDLHIRPINGQPDSFNESFLGKWIEFFGIEHESVVHPIRVIPDIYRTRIKSNVPEVYMKCKFTGIREDGRAQLECQLGSVRDDDGVITEYGEYSLWIVRHFRPQHSARWKISVYEKVIGQTTLSNGRAHSSAPIDTSYQNNKLVTVCNEKRPEREPPCDRPAPSQSTSVSQLAAALRRVVYRDSVSDPIMDYNEKLYDDLIDLLYPPDYLALVSRNLNSQPKSQ